MAVRSAPGAAPLALACLALLLAGCGNKGELFLPENRVDGQTLETIEEALDALEESEAEPPLERALEERARPRRPTARPDPSDS